MRDQLLQAGLITKKQSKEAGRERHQKVSAKGDAAQREPSLAEAEALRAAAEKKARDQELARQEQAKREQKERRAQIKQLVDQHRIAKPESDDLFNFVDGTRIRRLPVNPQLRADLVAGRIAIVRCDGRYELVAADIGQRIAERDSNALVHLAKPDNDADDNDPYKDYKVPDDLIW